MASQKVTDLTAQTTVHDTDTYHVVDTTNTTQDPAGSSNKITWLTMRTAIMSLFSAGAGITFSGGVIGTDPTATQTLTNKTLTGPVITSPTINVGSDATGDLLTRSSGGALARIPAGSAGQVLGLSGGLPAFIAPPATPSGTIAMFGGSTAPANWLLCNGQAVSRSTYSNLFTAITTNYGTGDGSTTFNLPNFQGNVAAGYKSGDSNFGTLGAATGEAAHTLTIAEMPSHNHTGTYNAGAGSATGNALFYNQGNGNLSGSAASQGGGGAHNNIQPSLTVNYIIAI